MKLSVEQINRVSPYKITKSKGGFEFLTQDNVRYLVSFTEEPPLGNCETYQFIFLKLTNSTSSYDPKVKETILAVISEFFIENMDVLLYICDTSDHREAVRNRLFVRWFEDFANPEIFTLKTAHAKVEGEGFFAAIIVDNRNPLLNDITEDFERTAKELSK